MCAGRSDASTLRRAVDMMRGSDWATLFFTAAIVGLYIANELRVSHAHPYMHQRTA